MKLQYLLMLVPMLVVGCESVELSEELTEQAVVSDTAYTPAMHGDGSGISTRGDFIFTSVNTQPVYAVVFEYQHGKFIIEGSDKFHRNLWEGLKKGQTVTVRYQEKYVMHDTTKVVVGYHFIGATPR